MTTTMLVLFALRNAAVRSPSASLGGAASNGWSSWNSEGSAGDGFPNAPAVGRNGDGRLELFAIAGDGNLWHKWQTAANNGWSPWASLGQAILMTMVPDVIGMATNAAEHAINVAHLLSTVTNPTLPPPPTRVLNQNPTATDGPVAQGSTVKLTLVHGLPL